MRSQPNESQQSRPLWRCPGIFESDWGESLGRGHAWSEITRGRFHRRDHGRRRHAQGHSDERQAPPRPHVRGKRSSRVHIGPRHLEERHSDRREHGRSFGDRRQPFWRHHQGRQAQGIEFQRREPDLRRSFRCRPYGSQFRWLQRQGSEFEWCPHRRRRLHQCQSGGCGFIGNRRQLRAAEGGQDNSAIGGAIAGCRWRRHDFGAGVR